MLRKLQLVPFGVLNTDMQADPKKKKKSQIKSYLVLYLLCYFLFQLLVAKKNKYWSVCASVYGYPFFNSVDRSWLKHVQPHSRYTQHLAVEDGDLCKVHGSF